MHCMATTIITTMKTSRKKKWNRKGQWGNRDSFLAKWGRSVNFTLMMWPICLKRLYLVTVLIQKILPSFSLEALFLPEGLVFSFKKITSFYTVHKSLSCLLWSWRVRVELSCRPFFILHSQEELEGEVLSRCCSSIPSQDCSFFHYTQ